MAKLQFPASPSDGDTFKSWVWSDSSSGWYFRDDLSSPKYEFEYIVVAGGGGGGAGGGNGAGGGGGAGGYRSSVTGELSGQDSYPEPKALYGVSDSFVVSVGAGGAANTSGVGDDDNAGGNSIFGNIISYGGGAGGSYDAAFIGNGVSGGSGGGGFSNNNFSGLGGGNVTGQGWTGSGYASPANFTSQASGGGGGAEQNGTDPVPPNAGAGGAGMPSSITGSEVFYAGGGGGSAAISGGSGGSGGLGGGGNGGDLDVTSPSGEDGEANTGGGGGGTTQYGIVEGVTLSSGGSGIVILKYPATLSLEVGAGLSSSTSTVGSYKVTSFTAGTDNVKVVSL